MPGREMPPAAAPEPAGACPSPMQIIDSVKEATGASEDDISAM
jgi:hypothetical protein